MKRNIPPNLELQSSKIMIS